MTSLRSHWLRIGLIVLCSGSLAIAGTDDTATLTKALKSVSGARMLKDVAHLSGPEFSGRQAGTTDDLRSGLWVADRFKLLGLQPALITTKQLNPIVREWAIAEQVLTTRIQDSPSLELFSGDRPIPARLGPDYLPILDSAAIRIDAPVAFVGYGISDPEHGVDDYAGVNVQQRVVLLLRGKPDHYSTPVTHADKERVAREKGAAASLMATGPILSAYETRRGIGGAPMASYSLSKEDRRLTGAWISTALAEAILLAKGRSLRELQAQLNREPKSQSHDTGVVAHISWNSWQTQGAVYNFLAMVPGHDPKRREETIVIGAHRDHFGRQGGLVFPGADDNASGTAVLLEVARALSKMKPGRTIVLVSFSGEEQGLLGSRLYVRQPVRPLPATKAMINVDHAGVGNGRLTVGLADLSRETATKAGKTAGLAEKLDLFGFFPGGDHVPFKEAGIPTAAVVSSGVHPDFHQPSDTADKIKPEILESTARFVLALSWQLANNP
ncbi:MAG: M28 family peptidase [Nitrospiraceae bacterium]|nr:M28 family peptidase [Nitrospiraceae bacterium]MSR25338.1 M28 family peptidase [Nitrospiraceae bacterium]